MASQLKRDLMKLQAQGNLGPSHGFSTKSASRPKAGGTAKIGSSHPTGANRSPQSAPANKKHTSGQRYFEPTPTGKATPSAPVKIVGKSYKRMPGF